MSRSSGFSLIEVVVAMGLLSIGLAATVPLVTYTIQRNSRGRTGTTAGLLANQALDRLRDEITHDPIPDPALDSVILPENVGASYTMPHGLALAIGPTGACAGDVMCCNPAGLNDGLAYNVAYPVRDGRDIYLVCYAVEQTLAADPKGAADPALDALSRTVRVKVVYSSGSGTNYSARTASAFLQGHNPPAGP